MLPSLPLSEPSPCEGWPDCGPCCPGCPASAVCCPWLPDGPCEGLPGDCCPGEPWLEGGCPELEDGCPELEGGEPEGGGVDAVGGAGVEGLDEVVLLGQPLSSATSDTRANSARTRWKDAGAIARLRAPRRDVGV